MPIPNAECAVVTVEKLVEYLLNADHPAGGAKARWFLSLGYERADPQRLARDLVKLVAESDDYVVVRSAFGVKFVVSGELSAPNRVVPLTTIWIVGLTNAIPKLVTAYPG